MDSVFDLHPAALGSIRGSDVIFSLEIFFSRDFSHYYLVGGQYGDRTDLVLMQGISQMQCSQGLSQALQKSS